MTNCFDKRDNCGTTVSSSCVPYTGSDLSSFDKEQLPCNPNLNDIVKELDSIIVTLKNATSITDVSVECLDNCNCETLTIKSLFEIIISKLCDTIEKVKILETSYSNIGMAEINVDLSCFDNPCFNSQSNNHTILEILTLLLTEVCTLKTKI